jgi:hypothetical protein
MLSTYALDFKARVVLSTHKKYGKEYPDTFTGKEAVACSFSNS